VVNIAFN